MKWCPILWCRFPQVVDETIESGQPEVATDECRRKAEHVWRHRCHPEVDWGTKTRWELCVRPWTEPWTLDYLKNTTLYKVNTNILSRKDTRYTLNICKFSQHSIKRICFGFIWNAFTLSIDVSKMEIKIYVDDTLFQAMPLKKKRNI